MNVTQPSSFFGMGGAGCDNRTASMKQSFIEPPEVVPVEQGVMWHVEYAHVLLQEIGGRLSELEDRLQVILTPRGPEPAEGSVKSNRVVGCPAVEQLGALHSRMHQVIDNIGTLQRRIAL